MSKSHRTPAGPASLAPIILPGSFEVDAVSGLALPTHLSRGDTEQVQVFLTLKDYAPSAASSAGETEAIENALRGHSRDELLCALGALNAIRADSIRCRQVMDDYVECLKDPARSALERELDRGHVFLARQPILQAVRFVLASDPNQSAAPTFSSLQSAVVLAHLMAQRYATHVRDVTSGARDARYSLVLEMYRNVLFNEEGDLYASIDRTYRLWTTYADQVRRHLPRTHPREMLKEACGVDLEDLLGLAIGAHAHVADWRVGRSFLLSPTIHPGAPPEATDAFVKFISATPQNVESMLRGAHSHWDFLPLQQHPILRLAGGLVVVDQPYLLSRVLSGLYWIVFDHEKSRGKHDHLAWSRTYSEMVELQAMDSIRASAPRTVGSAKTNHITEDDLRAAFPESKIVDGCVYFGGTLLAAEVTNSRFTVGTRVGITPESFEEDLEKVIFEKALQLDGAASSILGSPSALDLPVLNRIKPVIVVGETFPLIRPITQHIEDGLRERGLLQDGRVLRLAIVDVEELEMLEGVCERDARTPVEVLEAWRTSRWSDQTLRNYLLLGPMKRPYPDFRPKRMKPAVDAVFEQLLRRLGFERSTDS